ncbi:MAG TPA: tetratricopeptide repeat protein [Candidatus Acidoferrum sp.]|nr:tetratricopeptide repeat protein [Candidatus Acidoferrum sp.]
MSALGKVVFFFVLLFLVSSVLAQTRESPLEPIRSALRSKDFDKAIELSRAALQNSPNNPQLLTFEGIALASKGDSKNALSAFTQALKFSPNNIAALEGAAQIEYQAGSRAAVPLLERLLRLNPEEQVAHAMLAVLKYREGNCAGAASHFEKAGELINSQRDALHAYTTCLVRGKKLDQAEEVFERTVALNPDDPQERRLLASLQLMLHRPKDALETLRPVIEARDPNADALSLASSAYEDAGDTPNAVSTLRQAILLEPRNVSLYLDFANIAFAHESFQVGIDVISEGLTLQPQAAQLYLARGVLYVQLAQYDKAEEDFEKAQQLNPNESLGTAAQGLAAVQANDPEHALATVQSKLAKKPNDPVLLYLQADVITQKGAEPGTPEFQLAMRSARRAVALQPSLAPARGVLAKLYMDAGQYQQAADQCRKAIEIDPKDQTGLYRLIQALRKTGNKAEIPDLLKRLALLREQETKEERERYRYKLVEEDPAAKQPAQP